MQNAFKKHIKYILKMQYFENVINECSLPFDEEGYDEQRICKQCSVEKSTPDLAPINNIENWRGLAKQKSKKHITKYLMDQIR